MESLGRVKTLSQNLCALIVPYRSSQSTSDALLYILEGKGLRVEQRRTLCQPSLAACWGAQNCRAAAADHHTLGMAEHCRAADAQKLLRSDSAKAYPHSHLHRHRCDNDTQDII